MDKASLNRLLQAWEYSGILVYPGRRAKTIMTRIDDLDTELRKNWKTTWATVAKNTKRYLSTYADDGLDFNSIEEPEQLAQHQEFFKVALLEDTRAGVLGIEEGESMLFGGVEGVRLTEVDIAKEFSQMSPVRVFDSGMSIDDRQDLIRPLAEHSKEIVIVDRYAFSNTFGEHRSNGLNQLLNMLDETASVQVVAIYSATGDQRPEDIEEQLEAEIQGCSNIRKIKVYMPSSSYFGEESHGRFMRFDKYRACLIDLGIEEFFQNSQLRRRAQFTYLCGTVEIGYASVKSLIEAETALKKATGWRYHFTVERQ